MVRLDMANGKGLDSNGDLCCSTDIKSSRRPGGAIVIDRFCDAAPVMYPLPRPVHRLKWWLFTCSQFATSSWALGSAFRCCFGLQRLRALAALHRPQAARRHGCGQC